MINPTDIVPPTKGQCEQYVCLHCGHRFSKKIAGIPTLSTLIRTLFPIRCPNCKSTKCIPLPEELRT